MKCQSLSLLALSAASALASLDFQDSIRAEFKMGVLLPRQTVQNLQVFSGSLGGIKASAITNSGDTARPFEVDGDTFTDFQSAANRACDNQHNSCANAANSKQGTFEVGDCDKQDTSCKAAANTATQTSFQNTGNTGGTGTSTGQGVLVSSNAEFDFFCDP
ncbi:hypothetical protein GQ53DRAFT_831337 [Thozetella sp. PMI_491]|nr:hypothetical protein GQ53DRAFT_831337 [Thozetella sp. PMI_491]